MKVLTVISIFIGYTSALKIAVFSDPHLSPFYDPFQPDSNYCLSPSSAVSLPNPTVPSALLGRLNCDSPSTLIHTLLSRLNQTFQPDIMLIPGDFLAHKLAVARSQTANITLIKNVHDEVMDTVQLYLPYARVVPVIGNNDYEYHYNVP